MEPSQQNKYFRLGVIILKTKKQQWESLCRNQEAFKTKAQEDSEALKRPCFLKTTPSLLNSWQTHCKLHIDETNQIQIQYSQIVTALINFVQMQRVLICRPSPLPAPARQVFFSNQYQILDNYQSCFCFSLSVEIWALQSYLVSLTQKYQNYERNTRKSSNHAFFEIQRNNDDERVLKSREFLTILSATIKSDSSLPNNVPYLNPMMISNTICQETLARQEVEVLVKGTADMQKIECTNPVVSFNFDSERSGAGLFFDLNNQTVEEQPNPAGFEGELKSYQARALTWMLHREGKAHETGIDMSHVPYWVDKGGELGLRQKLFLNMDLNFVVWNKPVVKKCDGGILADDMGLGKTIMVIALILANKPTNHCKTLIIAPLSVIKQWYDQIKKFAPHLSVAIAHQTPLTQNRIRQLDIVITTEGKIRAQSQKDRAQALISQYKWFRIVIDEAHNFKNSKTQMAKAVYELNSVYRWCLTGTPTQNSLGDLFSLIKFLRFQPWCHEKYWESRFPKDTRKTNIQHFQNMKSLLKGILLRRKKQSLDEKGLTLLNLPKVDVKVHLVQMSQEAKKIYNIVDWKAKNTLTNLENIEESLRHAKSKVRRLVLNQKKKLNLNKIFSLLSKLRMVCCHQFLTNYSSEFVSCHKFIQEYIKHLGKNKVLRVPKYNFFQYSIATAEEKQHFHRSTANLNSVYENWDEKIREISLGMQPQCLICHQIDESVVTPCLHFFCKKCIDQFIEAKWSQHNLDQKEDISNAQLKQKLRKEKLKDFQSYCPYCKQKLKLRQVFPLPRTNEFNRPLQQFQPNQKILMLLEYLKKMNESDKALIFTSFLGMMTLISRSLSANNITYTTIRGTDNHEVRHSRISEFSSNKQIQVLLLTLKTGSVGLNMEAANKVFFMDPWWNPAIEEQAIGRVYRLGQKKEVEAVKFITQSTIQARILKLSLLKKQMSDSVLDIDDFANDKRYSKTRSQIKFLLSVQQSYQEEQESQNEHPDV